jgi:ferric-dicitrate binding protein FerR (iron transport regulator)
MEGVYETLSKRVDDLIEADTGPFLSTTGTHAAIKELIARSEAHEKALREIAREVQELAAGPRPRALKRRPDLTRRPRSMPGTRALCRE